jgi:hypothetical protein
MRKLSLLFLLLSTNAVADCITVNGQVYCNNNAPMQLTPPTQNLYIPNTPYYPPPAYTPPQVIVVPQITPGNPNFQKYEYDTGRVIKRNEK